MTRSNVTIRTGSNQRDVRTMPVNTRITVSGTTCTVTAMVPGFKALTRTLRAVLPSETTQAAAQLVEAIQRDADELHAKARAERKYRVEAQSGGITGGKVHGAWCYDADWQAREKFAELIRVGFTRELVLEAVNGYGEHVARLAVFNQGGF